VLAVERPHVVGNDFRVIGGRDRVAIVMNFLEQLNQRGGLDSKRRRRLKGPVWLEDCEERRDDADRKECEQAADGAFQEIH